MVYIFFEVFWEENLHPSMYMYMYHQFLPGICTVCWPVLPYSHRYRATRLQVHILCVSFFLHQFHHLTSTTEECTDMTHFRDACTTRRPHKVIKYALQVRKCPPPTLYPPPPPPPPPTRRMYSNCVPTFPEVALRLPGHLTHDLRTCKGGEGRT